MSSRWPTGAEALSRLRHPARLPPGRHGLPRELVVENQRCRLLEAAADVHRARGYAATNVTEITARAGVSRATFYKLFEGKPECVAAAQLDVSERLGAEIRRAWELAPEWPDRVDAMVDTTLSFATHSPAQAFLLFSDPLFAEPDLANAPLVFHTFLVDLLRSGRDADRPTDAVPGLTEQAQIGAFRTIVASRLLSGEEAELPAMKAELVRLMLAL